MFIVPALIINAVEAMVRAKSKFSKRTRSSADALFTDDGFVMGLAYLLKVSLQTSVNFTKPSGLKWISMRSILAVI